MKDHAKATKSELLATDFGFGNFKLHPHPDGKPWAKCCNGTGETGPDTNSSCQCFMKKPRNRKSRFEGSKKSNGSSSFPGIDDLIREKGRFFCCHRLTEDGYHRECAGWAAKITGNKP